MQDQPRSAVSVVLDAPGSSLEGSVIVVRVRLSTDDAVAIRGGEVALTRTIAYRYRQGSDGGPTHLATERRSETVVRQSLPPRTPVVDARPYDAEVLVPVPADGPPSADSELVAVDWTVRARLDLGALGVAQAVQKIAVLTEAERFADALALPPRTDDRGHDVVRLERLSSRRIAPGQRLTGDVVVLPLQGGPIRDVRIELVLLEHVPHGPADGDGDGALSGPGAKDAETVVASVDLGSAMEVETGLPTVRLPFVLDVPVTLRAPSMATPEFTLRWVLRAVVNRPLRRDAYVEVALQAVTVRR